MDLNLLTGADFRARLNQSFTIQLTGGEEYPLTLVGVTDLGEPVQDGGRRPFSLQFVHPRKDAYLPQRTYRLSHGELGDLEIFLVPHGPIALGMSYEAIFS